MRKAVIKFMTILMLFSFSVVQFSKVLDINTLSVNAAPAKNKVIKVPNVNYQSYVQTKGWNGYSKNGVATGIPGKNLRLESFRINLSNLPILGGITYSASIQNRGWQKPVSNNQLAGTVGKNLKLEAINIKLTGAISQQYDVYYRTYIQNHGWLGWAKNGVNAGSEGKGLRLEAIEIKLIKKGIKMPIAERSFVRKDGVRIPILSKPKPTVPVKYYKNCKEMLVDHKHGAVIGDPWYDPKHDKDGDGKECWKDK